jgi:hypothetical protein
MTDARDRKTDLWNQKIHAPNGRKEGEPSGEGRLRMNEKRNKDETSARSNPPRLLKPPLIPPLSGGKALSRPPLSFPPPHSLP